MAHPSSSLLHSTSRYFESYPVYKINQKVTSGKIKIHTKVHYFLLVLFSSFFFFFVTRKTWESLGFHHNHRRKDDTTSHSIQKEEVGTDLHSVW